MQASYEATYERLVLSVRQSASRAMVKASPQQMYSSDTPSGVAQADASLSQEAQQYQASLRGWQFAAIKVIATACAAQEIRVGVQRGRKRSTKKTKDEFHKFSNCPVHIKALSEQIDILNVHPIIDLIENPNRFPAGLQFSLKWCTVFSLNATGKAYWLLAKNEGREGGLDCYYLPSTWVRPAVNEAKVQVGWAIKNPQEMGKAKVVPFEDVIPFVIADPSHPAYALSYLQTQAPSINIDDKIQTANYRAMENGIYPGLALHVAPIKNPDGQEVIPQLTTDQRKQLIDTVMAAASGATRYGLPFIIDGMINKISPVTNKPLEMDFTGGAKAMQERIFLAYGVNPIVAGQIENANRASSFVAHEGFYRTVVNPLLTLMSQTLTKYLAPRYKTKGLYVWFEEALARDEDLHLRQLQLGLDHGLLEGNEYREAIGIHPHAELNKLVTPLDKANMGVGRPNGT